MRRFVPVLLLGLASFAPVPLLGCDLLKPKGADAGADGALAAATPDTATPTAAAATDTAGGAAAPGAPLNPATPGAGGVRPVVKTDGGAVATTDAGAVKTDGGAIPAPTPTLPAFDAGAFKGFDAGGLLRGFDGGGFKPPWPPK